MPYVDNIPFPSFKNFSTFQVRYKDPLLTHQTRSYSTTWPVPALSCLPFQLHPPSHAHRPCHSSLPTLPAWPCHAPRPGPPSLLIWPTMPPDHHTSTRQPCQPCPSTLPAMPADAARQARRPAQQTRPAVTSPLLRLRCLRPGQPRIFQLPTHQCQLAHFP